MLALSDLNKKTAGFRPPLVSMDARVKPGHDDLD
jgi:hypothetical protein